MLGSIISIALALSVSPIDVCTIISYETAGTMSTSTRGVPTRSGERAVGLIQFMPNTAKELGTTVAELSNMTFKEQSEYVTTYFNKRRFKAKHDGLDLVRMYSTVFCGNSNYKRCSKLSDGYNRFVDIINIKIKEHKTKCNRMFKQ